MALAPCTLGCGQLRSAVLASAGILVLHHAGLI
jgi:hypothetical protein